MIDARFLTDPVPRRPARRPLATLRRPFAAAMLALLLAPLLCLLPGTSGRAAAQDASRGRITGTIEDAPVGVTVAGARVVLVQFKLDGKGVPKGQPIREATVDAQGSFRIDDVPIEPQTVYQVGASVGEQVVGSQPFTFPEGKRNMELALHYPRLVSDASGVRIEEGLIAVEPRRAGVWVTEVLHLVNPGQDIIEGVQRPMELNLPSGAEKLEIVRELQSRNGHERLGNKLLFYGNLEPGNSTVAYRYHLPVWLGTVELNKTYPHAVKMLSVLTPEGTLRLLGQRFEARPMQTIDGKRFSAWAATDIAAGQSIAVRMSGVSMRQEVYLVPTGGFAVLMVGVVIWFLRRRLGAGGASASA